MKKILLFSTALASLLLVGCTSDDLTVVQADELQNEQTPIMFSSKQGATTRDIAGKEAAALLGDKFVVSGYKGSSTATPGIIVFDNYSVVWEENTSNTTASNSTNWEYVGKDRIKHAIDNGITRQAIKYWDFSQPQYDFIAWSTGSKTAIYEGTPTAGQVLVSAITPANATGATGTAYTFKGAAADLEGCYIADLVTVKKASYGSDPVMFHFRSLGSKVRIALYETVPGYSVKDVYFYTDDVTGIDAAITNTDATLYTTTANDIYTQGTYTVYYPTVDDESDSDNNQAHVKFTGDGTQATTVGFSALNYQGKEDGEKGTDYLGRTSSNPSFAGEAATNYYTVYLPNENGTNLNLRVNYTLESIDGSGEVIKVYGASAIVPAQYASWKSNFAYTYIFKISDNTNGWTSTVSTDPAGLYPITFDAVAIETEEHTQATVTNVTSPTITTYQMGHDVSKNEYAAGDIYVQVMADGALKADLGSKGQLYTLSVAASEAEVMDALNIQASATTTAVTGRNGLVLTKATSDATITAVPGVDGNNITVAAGTAATFAATAATTYAYVYTVSTGTPEDKIEEATLTTAPDGWPTGYYTDAACTTAASAPFAAGTYYNKYTKNTSVYGVKVIKVE